MLLQSHTRSHSGSSAFLGDFRRGQKNQNNPQAVLSFSLSCSSSQHDPSAGSLSFSSSLSLSLSLSLSSPLRSLQEPSGSQALTGTSPSSPSASQQGEKYLRPESSINRETPEQRRMEGERETETETERETKREIERERERQRERGREHDESFHVSFVS